MNSTRQGVKRLEHGLIPPLFFSWQTHKYKASAYYVPSTVLNTYKYHLILIRTSWAGTIILIFQMRRLRHRDIKSVVKPRYEPRHSAFRAYSLNYTYCCVYESPCDLRELLYLTHQMRKAGWMPSKVLSTDSGFIHSCCVLTLGEYTRCCIYIINKADMVLVLVEREADINQTHK